jgi:hypothetical protein
MRVLEKWSREREREWARAHDDGLQRRAERAMHQWKKTLSPRDRALVGEPTRRERVTMEIQEERSRRTVCNDSGGRTGHGATTGLDHSASAVRKA